MYKMSEFQAKFLQSEDQQVIALCGIGSGKSYVASFWAAKELLEKRSTLVIAQTYDALNKVIMTEIYNRLTEDFNIKLAKWNHGSNEITIPGIKARINGATALKADHIRGLTNFSNLLIDEAACCPSDTYDIAIGRLRGESDKIKIRLISTPKSGQFARWFSDLVKKPTQTILHCTTFDNPFTTAEYKQLVAEKYEQGSDLYRQELLGQIVENEILNSIIRLEDFSTICRGQDRNLILGIDMARYGNDSTVIAIRDRYSLKEIVKLHKADTDKVVSVVQTLVEGHKVEAIYIDATGGFGSGVEDMLKKFYHVVPVNFAEKSIDNSCSNMRSNIYFNLVAAIKDGFYIDIDKFQDIREQLMYTTYILDSKGKKQLVPKESIKAIIGHSPDEADALAVSFCDKVQCSMSDYEICKVGESLFF